MASFSELGLNPVLLQTLKRRGFVTPTPIQLQCIPAVLRGKDVLALSKTGSGKTLAYLLPLLQKLLTVKETQRRSWMALILVPTKELIIQVSEECLALIQGCGVRLKVSAFPGVGVKNAAEVLKGEIGSVVVCTPRQISAWLQTDAYEGEGRIGSVETLVVDEADLILSYGYDADMRFISPKLPRSCQCILVSATRSSDLDGVVKLVMENPVKVDLLRPEVPLEMTGVTSHYYLECAKEEKALHLLVLLQFRAVEKPVMIFVNGIRDGYRLRLFLECFRVTSALLHRELPLDTRQGLIDEFNQGRHQVFVVVDDLQSIVSKEEDTVSKRKRKSSSKRESKEAEFGVARGLDFKNVKVVINFDLPQSLNGYLHRVGRTGRAANHGMALTFLTPNDKELQQEIGHHLSESTQSDGGRNGEDAFQAFLNFDRGQVAALKYRAEDVMRSLKSKTIEAARKKDLRREMLKSAELQLYFEAHPAEKQLLEKMESQNLKQKFSNVNKLPAYIAAPEGKGNEGRGATQQSRKVPRIDPLSRKIPARRPGQRKKKARHV